jgi:hypothetical protein
MTTIGEAFMKLVEGDPQFQEAPRTGGAVVVVGRPTCRGRRCTGRRPGGTCKTSAREYKRRIVATSKTSPVFKFRKPPLSSVVTKSPIEGLLFIDSPHDIVDGRRLATRQDTSARAFDSLGDLLDREHARRYIPRDDILKADTSTARAKSLNCGVSSRGACCSRRRWSRRA